MITFPLKPKIIESKGNRAIFEIEACYPGYGTTIGNALRRVLLSSLPGAAITGVKIKGVQHEFSTIPYVLEDVVQIILNLKQIRFKLYTSEPTKVFLKVRGEKKVTATDIKTTSEIEVINPEAHIAVLTDKKSDLEIEMEVESGLGYASSERQKKKKVEIGKIAIDSIFSPVRLVNYSVENMRVGERTDYDRLRITIETDGTISPEDALIRSAKILVDHFGIFVELEKKQKAKKKKTTKEVKIKSNKKSRSELEDKVKAIKIEELKLSGRVNNSLSENGIKTVGGLLRKSEDDLMSMEGLGERAVVEIRKAIGRLGLTLKAMAEKEK